MQIDGAWIISPLNNFPRGLRKGEYGFKKTALDFKSTFQNAEECIIDL